MAIIKIVDMEGLTCLFPIGTSFSPIVSSFDALEWNFLKVLSLRQRISEQLEDFVVILDINFWSFQNLTQI